MRRLVVVLVALVVVAGAVYFGSQRLLERPAVEAPPVALGNGAVQMGAVRCRGRVVPIRWLGLRFAAGGQVVRLAVQEGDAVRQGDLLAELAGEDFGLELRAAEQRLLSAQAQLAQAQATPAPAELQAARAQVDAGRARLEALRAGPSEAQLQEARLQIERAKNTLWGLQNARDAIGGNPPSPAAFEQAKASVAVAEIGVRLAELSYEVIKAGPAPDAIAAAESQLAQAEAALAGLVAAPAPEELALLRANVGQAEVALEQVRERQKRAEAERQLCAPFDGVVAAIAIQVGQTVGPGSEALVLADLSELLVETIDLGELDVASVRLEQPVEVSIPAASTPFIQGRVTYISPQATISPTGEALYRALVSLNRQEPSLRWGMSANLTFGKRLK